MPTIGSEQLRVLLVNVLYPPPLVGGAERSVQLLASGLREVGIKVEVLSLHSGSKVVTGEEAGIMVTRLPLDNVYWPFEPRRRGVHQRFIWHLKDIFNRAAATRVGAYLDSSRPDVMHTNNIRGFSTSIWWAAHKRGIPIVHTLRDYSAGCVRGPAYRNGRVCKALCMGCNLFSSGRRMQSRYVSSVVGNSKFTLDLHKQWGFFPGVPASVIFSPALRPRNELELGIPSLVERTESKLRLGFLGRLEPTKGLEDLLGSLTHVDAANWELCIAGTGSPEYVRELQKLAGKLPVRWLGFIDSDRFFAEIDVCIVPSVWPEPLPRAILEALAAGKSIICSDAGGNAEAAALAMRALVYRQGDQIQLARCIETFIRDLDCRRLGGFKSQHARDLLRPATVARLYADVYRSSLEARSSGGG